MATGMVYLGMVYLGMVYQGLQKVLSKEESLELGFELKQVLGRVLHPRLLANTVNTEHPRLLANTVNTEHPRRLANTEH